MSDIVQKAIELLEDWDTCYSYNEEIRDTAIAALKTQDDEITRLRKENEQLRDSYDTEALLISYNLGYACGKDITKDIVKDEIERRHAEFTKVDMELVADLAAERNRLRAENEKLREALRPFAAAIVSYDDPDIDSGFTIEWDIYPKDLEAARKALESGDE